MREVDYAVFRYRVQEMLPAIQAWLGLVEDSDYLYVGYHYGRENFARWVH